MEVSTTVASCSEPSLYAFNPSLSNQNAGFSITWSGPFPNNFFARSAVCAPLCRALMHSTNTSVYQLCINPFISFHLILGHFKSVL